MAAGVIHKKQYAEVIVPAALPQNFTWSIPTSLQGHLSPGHRVLINLGKQKKYVGIIKSIGVDAPSGLRVKEIIQQLDETPFVRLPLTASVADDAVPPLPAKMRVPPV